MVSEIPDRVSVDEDSPFYWHNYLNIRVWFRDKERTDVLEFCRSEGWVKIRAIDSRGRPKTERGNYIPIKLMGKVVTNLKVKT